MVFNAVSARNGIIQAIERKTDLGLGYISGDANRLADFTADINNENHKVWHTIFMSNGNWQYDDGNYADLPQAVTDLVSGTSLYALPPTALTIQRVECKNASGDFYQLEPITTETLEGIAISEFMEADSQPMYYRLINGSAEIFPASNYASTGGLKVYFDRDSVDFLLATPMTATENNQTPGFASPYHEILAIGVAIEWLKIKQPNSPTLPQLQADYLKMEDAIKKFYGKRFKDYKSKIGRAYQSYK